MLSWVDILNRALMVPQFQQVWLHCVQGFHGNYYGNNDAENVPRGTQLWIITNWKHFAFASQVKCPFSESMVGLLNRKSFSCIKTHMCLVSEQKHLFNALLKYHPKDPWKVLETLGVKFGTSFKCFMLQRNFLSQICGIKSAQEIKLSFIL